MSQRTTALEANQGTGTMECLTEELFPYTLVRNAVVQRSARQRSGRKTALLLTLIPVLVCGRTTAADEIYQPVDFSQHFNVGPIYAGYPCGEVILGGIPFSIPCEGNNTWFSREPDGKNPRMIEIPVGIFGVEAVHTLINTAWGQPGPRSYAWLEFDGSDGAHYRFDLVGNDDVRDWSDNRWTGRINGCTTINVFSEVPDDGTERRLDKQLVELPEEFLFQTLDTIRMYDNGGEMESRAFLYGITLGVPQQIDFSEHFNVGPIYAGYPCGEVILGGIPFSIPCEGNNTWFSREADGNNPRMIEIPVGIFGVDVVHTLMNTAWGQPGPESYVWLKFTGSEGAEYHKNLIGNCDIRDWSNNSWTNQIKPPTVNVFSENPDGTELRLDMQFIDLPPEFLSQRLETIRVYDDGDERFSRAFLYGVTVGPDSRCQRNPDWLCDGDVDGDGQVNPVDSGLINAKFGSEEECDLCQYDVDCDGQISPVDAGIVQALFGTCEEPRDRCP